MVYSPEGNTLPPSAMERYFVYIYLSMLGTCYYYVFSDLSGVDTLDKAGNSTAYQVIWISLYIGLILFCMRSATVIISRLLIPTGLIILSALAYVRDDGIVTMDAIVTLAMFLSTFIFGAWAATRFTFREFFNIYYRLACVVAVGHLLLYPILSSLSGHFDSLARPNLFGFQVYAGLFAHKNQAGLFFGIAFIIGFAKLLYSPQPATLKGLVPLLILFFCLGSAGAASPLLSTIAGCLAMVLATVIARNGMLGLAFAAVIFTLFCILSLDTEAVLAFVGRDLSFTGRDFLYERWPDLFMEHPFIGYGHGMFFADETSSPGVYLNSERLFGHYINFESGFLQTGIDFGGIGLALILFLYIRNLSNGLSSAQATRYDTLIPIGLVVFFLISTLNEVYIVAANTMTPAMMFFIYTSFRLRVVEPLSGTIPDAANNVPLIPFRTLNKDL